MGSSPPSRTSSTTTNELPGWLTPYAQNFVELNQQTFAPGNQIVDNPYPDQQVAAFVPFQEAGMRAIAGQALPPQPFNPNAGLPPGVAGVASNAQAAPGSLPGMQAVTGGGPVNSTQLVNNAMQMQNSVMGQNAIDNPLLSKYFDSAADSLVGNFSKAVMPGINASALKAGAFGGSGHQQTVDMAQQNLMRGVEDLATQIYMPAWESQEARRQQAAYMSPYLQQASYVPGKELLAAGGAQQQQEQNVLNTLYQNLYNRANWPFQALNQLGQGVGMAMGGSGNTQTVQMKG